MQSKIQKAVLSVRKEWLRNTIADERKLNEIYQAAYDDISALILKKVEAGDTIPVLRLKAIKDEIKSILQDSKNESVKQIKQSIRSSVNSGMNSSIAGIKAAIPENWDNRFNLDVVRGSVSWTKINTDAVDFLLRYPADGISLSEKIWKYNNTAYQGIISDVSSGVVQGKSVGEIARAIKPRLLFPERDLRLKAVKALHPGAGVYRSANANALRIARTEVGRAYVEGQSRYGQSKEWIKGYIRREPGDALGDECAQAKDKYYEKGTEPDLFHPNCMGYNEPVIDFDMFGINP